MPRDRYLIIEGDAQAAATLRGALCEHGLDAVEATSIESAMALVPSFGPAVILADVTLAGCDGPALLSRLHDLGSDAEVVAAVPLERTDAAVAALRAGAGSFLVSPLDPAHVAVALEKAAEGRRLRLEGARLRDRIRGRLAVVGTAPDLLAAYEVVRRVAPTKATVLLHGEAGTGRGHLAQALHELSPRRDRPFVRFNCAALSEAMLESELFGHEQGAFEGADARRIGRFEQAQGGTLYLHEVERLPPGLQVKLLRVLQEGLLERTGGRQNIPVDVRVVASAQRDLADEVHAGRFRDDLYYRLNVVSVGLPALRDRKADIPSLVTHFIEQLAGAAGKRITGVTPGVLSTLFAYDWPGNLRELEALVERAVESATGHEIASQDLPPVLQGARVEEGGGSALIPGATLFEIEREAILRTLERVEGSTARAAEILGVSVRKIQYRLKEYKSGQSGRRRVAADAFGHDVHEK